MDDYYYIYRMIFLVLLLVGLLDTVNAHGFLNSPVSRNAVSRRENGYCTWGGIIPCTGDSQSWNQPEPHTGCGITQAGGEPYVFGTGSLSFAKTGILTTVNAGETVQMEVIITAHHGGIVQFRIQDGK